MEDCFKTFAAFSECLNFTNKLFIKILLLFIFSSLFVSDGILFGGLCLWLWVRLTQLKHMCDNYVPQWWVVFNDELRWVFTKRFRTSFILFAENGQILRTIYVIPILLAFIYLVAHNLLVNNQLNSLLQHIIVTHAIVKLNKGKLDRKLKWNQQQDLYICVIVNNAQALCT